MSYADCTSSEPLVLLAWDIRTSEHLTEAVVHIGSAKSVAALQRRKRLPSLEEVKAAERARRAK
jgi:hypothetical protein